MKSSRGTIFVVLSAFFFGTYGIWSKMMAFKFDDFTQSWLRGLIVVLILLPIGLASKNLKKIRKKDIKWFLTMSIPGALVFPFYFIGFKYLDISTATLLFYSSLTITTFILGIFIYKDEISILKIVSLIIGIVGLIITFSISLNDTYIFPAIITILAGICGGVEVSFTKKISSRYSPIQLTLFLYSIDFILNIILNFIVRNEISFTSDFGAWIGLLMFSFSGLLSFLFVSLGYKYTEASVAAVIGLLEIPFSITFGIAFFDESLSISTITGTILIIIASSINDIYKAIRKNRV